ncbi:mucin-5AC-like [Homarus americanus]|uniref:mucin-5AC-like n=1 Tax=Homarus americanus TaxID=6706 RepID=UPI001C477067|nr:mucin-5AC-like [Homarus americanus]
MGGLRVSVRAWLLWAVLSYVSGSEGVSTGYRRSQAGRVCGASTVSVVVSSLTMCAALCDREAACVGFSIEERSPLRRLCEKVLQSGGTCDGDSHYSFYTAPDNTLTTLPDTTSSGGNTGATSTGITALSKVHTDITTETWTTNPMFTPTDADTTSQGSGTSSLSDATSTIEVPATGMTTTNTTSLSTITTTSSIEKTDGWVTTITTIPTPTTTITATSTPAPTTTITATTETVLIENKEVNSKCPSNTGVSTLSLKPEEEKMVNLDYLACSKFLTNNNFGVSSSVSRQINTARCGTNEVIVGFEAYDQVNFQSPNTNWDNALYLYSVCSQLVNYQVKSGECEIVQVSNVPWTGIKDVGDMKTDLWDYWFSCSPDYLAVQVNRETNGDLRQVVNIECCRVSPN